MTEQDVFDFAHAYPTSWISTSESGGQPHVRGMLLWFADENGLYYHTATCKQLAEQLDENPKVEIAFFRPTEDLMENSMLRVEGVAETVDDAELEKRLLEERPWLEANIGNLPEGAGMRIFRIVNCSARFWNLTHNGREAGTPRIEFA